MGPGQDVMQGGPMMGGGPGGPGGPMMGGPGGPMMPGPGGGPGGMGGGGMGGPKSGMGPPMMGPGGGMVGALGGPGGGMGVGAPSQSRFDVRPPSMNMGMGPPGGAASKMAGDMASQQMAMMQELRAERDRLAKDLDDTKRNFKEVMGAHPPPYCVRRAQGAQSAACRACSMCALAGVRGRRVGGGARRLTTRATPPEGLGVQLCPLFRGVRCPLRNVARLLTSAAASNQQLS
eukprot:6782277-Pyramimonas_sp.AAC.1